MISLLCRLVGHRNILLRDSSIYWRSPFWRRDVILECPRCGERFEHHRWAFMPDAGALVSFGDVELPRRRA